MRVAYGIIILIVLFSSLSPLKIKQRILALTVSLFFTYVIKNKYFKGMLY